MKAVLLAAFGISLLGAEADAQQESRPKNADGLLELTMVLAPAGTELPKVVTAQIEIPQEGSFREAGANLPNDEAVARSARAIDSGSPAREAGRELGEVAAAAARDDRESAARASRSVADGTPPLPPLDPSPPASPPR